MLFFANLWTGFLPPWYIHSSKFDFVLIIKYPSRVNFHLLTFWRVLSGESWCWKCRTHLVYHFSTSYLWLQCFNTPHRYWFGIQINEYDTWIQNCSGCGLDWYWNYFPHQLLLSWTMLSPNISQVLLQLFTVSFGSSTAYTSYKQNMKACRTRWFVMLARWNPTHPLPSLTVHLAALSKDDRVKKKFIFFAHSGCIHSISLAYSNSKSFYTYNLT